MSERKNSPIERAAFDPSQYPQVQVVSITKEDRADGYDGQVRLYISYLDGQSTDITAKVVLRDYPWGSEWQAELEYEGQIPSLPDAAPVQIRHRALYGTVQGEKRLDTLESENHLRDGQRRTSRNEAKPRPNTPRRDRTAQEYEQWAKEYLSDAAGDDNTDEDDEDTQGNEVDDLFEEPLRMIPLMVGILFTFSAFFGLPE